MPTTSHRVQHWGELSCWSQDTLLFVPNLVFVPFLVFVLHVVVNQQPLGGSGEDPAGIGRAPFHPDVRHVVGKQLLTPKVLKLLGLLHVLVCQKVLNLIKERWGKFWGKTSPHVSAWQTSSHRCSPPWRALPPAPQGPRPNTWIPVWRLFSLSLLRHNQSPQWLLPPARIFARTALSLPRPLGITYDKHHYDRKGVLLPAKPLFSEMKHRWLRWPRSCRASSPRQSANRTAQSVRYITIQCQIKNPIISSLFMMTCWKSDIQSTTILQECSSFCHNVTY